VKAHSTTPEQAQNYYFGSLEGAPAAVRTAAGSLIPLQDAPVLILHVPAGVRCTETPLRLSDARTHLLVHLEAGAQADISVWLEGKAMHHNAEVILAAEARCTLLTVNVTDTDIALTQRGVAAGGGMLRWQNVTMGTGKITHDLISTVTGDNGESAVDWMFYAKGTEQQTLNVRNVFNGTNGRGEILMRGIAEQKGHAQCRGLIEIGLQGGGTNTYLTQEVLMLDPTSKVDAIPSLEIKTNDVKASHSATVARVTEEDLFYFGARGIDPQEARRMFVLGFLGDITGRIESTEQRETIVGAIEAKYSR
jgi:Fe-S cluster assembly protein SufD